MRKNLMKLASWNVNGLRACWNKGFREWVEKNSPDIIALQETKSWPEQLSEEQLNITGYKSYFAVAEKKGYSGVALYIKNNIKDFNIKDKINIKKFDSEGRTLILETPKFCLINGYYPNGQRDHGRVDFKLEYSHEIKNIAQKINQEKPIVLCGDFNTAHKAIDLANPKANKNTTGFLLHEREFIDELIEAGYTDCLRFKAPNQEGLYTWWTYRSNCRERNIGWRIDYFFISDDIKNKIKDCYHQAEVLGSDHCPIILDIKL